VCLSIVRSLFYSVYTTLFASSISSGSLGALILCTSSVSRVNAYKSSWLLHTIFWFNGRSFIAFINSKAESGYFDINLLNTGITVFIQNSGFPFDIAHERADALFLSDSWFRQILCFRQALCFHQTLGLQFCGSNTLIAD